MKRFDDMILIDLNHLVEQQQQQQQPIASSHFFNDLWEPNPKQQSSDRFEYNQSMMFGLNTFILTRNDCILDRLDFSMTEHRNLGRNNKRKQPNQTKIKLFSDFFYVYFLL